jgi:hypothetical protein
MHFLSHAVHEIVVPLVRPSGFFEFPTCSFCELYQAIGRDLPNFILILLSLMLSNRDLHEMSETMSREIG